MKGEESQPSVAGAGPPPTPSLSTLFLQTSRAIVKTPEGCAGAAGPEGILGISPFSTSYGNALEGTGNWASSALGPCSTLEAEEASLTVAEGKGYF